MDYRHKRFCFNTNKEEQSSPRLHFTKLVRLWTFQSFDKFQFRFRKTVLWSNLPFTKTGVSNITITTLKYCDFKEKHLYNFYKTRASLCTGLFEMNGRVLTTCHLVLQTQSHVISFCAFTSRIRFMFLLFPQVSRKWRYESEPPLKPSPLTCYKQFGTNSIIVLMFVESQRVHI